VNIRLDLEWQWVWTEMGGDMAPKGLCGTRDLALDFLHPDIRRRRGATSREPPMAGPVVPLIFGRKEVKKEEKEGQIGNQMPIGWSQDWRESRGPSGFVQAGKSDAFGADLESIFPFGGRPGLCVRCPPIRVFPPSPDA